MKELIQQGEDDNLADRQGWTPLHFAAQSYDAEMADLLLDTEAPTFPTEVGKGRRIELPRYVNSAALPPDIDLSVNFRTAIARRPASPEMPDPRALPCLYLAKVNPVGHDE